MPQAERPNMQGYGVPTDLDGVLPWEWAETRLLSNRNYWLTTVDVDGAPHSMPVWGIWLGDQERFWFSCSPQALKTRNLASNPNAVVTTDDTIEVVSIEGTVAERPADAGIADAYGVKYETDAVKRAELVGFMMQQNMFEFTPIRGFGVIEREEEFSERATRWVWS